jgi:hypothetical protein
MRLLLITAHTFGGDCGVLIMPNQLSREQDWIWLWNGGNDDARHNRGIMPMKENFTLEPEVLEQADRLAPAENKMVDGPVNESVKRDALDKLVRYGKLARRRSVTSRRTLTASHGLRHDCSPCGL